MERWRSIVGLAGGAVVAQVLMGGIRPVDGSMLARLAREGFAAELPPFAQYLFDSPLKIVLLKALGLQSPTLLAGLFLLLCLLPFAAALLAEDDERRKTAFLLAAALPLTRVSLGSLGVGDAVMFAGAIAIVASRSRWIALVASAVLVGWHVQQGILLLGFVVALSHAMGERRDRARLAMIGIGVVLGVAFFLLSRQWLGAPYQGRLGFLLAHIDRFALRIAFYWPVAIAVALPGFLLLWLTTGFKSVSWLLFAATAASLAVAGMTSDVSRVFFVLHMPMVMLVLLRPGTVRLARSPAAIVPVMALSAVVPLLTWSGVELFDWKALAQALLKYGAPSE
ncbi:MAG TPA: hypothetical protein VEC60_09075, partial [Reyranella sp.]|nr:hypothetical protein [Reyranella sp.]